MRRLPVALQVYSVRDEAEKDFSGTMRQVRAMGYDGIELAGLYGNSPERIRDILHEIGLPAISAHVPYADLAGAPEETIAQYVTIGCQYIAVPYLTEEYRPGTERFPEVVENIRKIGEACRRRHVVLLYHNHDFEFGRTGDGRYALDYLYDTVPAELLQTEIDTCWAKVSGVDPAGYIRRYKGRSPVVHLKDFTGGKSDGMYQLIGRADSGRKAEGTFAFAAVGYGKQDFPSILEASVEAGAKWVVVEQDQHYGNTAMEDSRLSREYLKKLGW